MHLRKIDRLREHLAPINLIHIVPSIVVHLVNVLIFESSRKRYIVYNHATMFSLSIAQLTFPTNHPFFTVKPSIFNTNETHSRNNSIHLMWKQTITQRPGQGVDNRQYRDWETDRKSTRLNSSHSAKSRMPSSA